MVGNMATEAIFYGTHPTSRSPHVAASGDGAQDVSTKTLLLAANPARVRFTIQNKSTTDVLSVYVGDSKTELAAATSNNGGVFDEPNFKGAVYVEGAASHDFSYFELSL